MRPKNAGPARGRRKSPANPTRRDFLRTLGYGAAAMAAAPLLNARENRAKNKPNFIGKHGDATQVLET
ncbi:MAG: twin-arginine translocation signal domain-containing protein [Phycisphaerae bacterium]|nr:twin-arginine translocation signal domain-containing protein [Phycisphaerae bacterium]